MNNFLNNYDAAFINAFDEEYKNAKLENSRMELPEGRYQFVVTEVKIVERNNLSISGKKQDQYYEHQLVIGLKVISEDCKGVVANKYNGLCLDRVKAIKADLSAMGHEFEGLEKLAEDIENGTMIGLIIDGHVTKRPGKDKNRVYTNIWLDRCVGKLKPEEMGYSPVDDDEELPWG